MRRNAHKRFAYRLAVTLKRVNVDAMLRSLSARQFLEWEAAFEIESFGEQRADARAASIVRALYNVNRGKDQTPYELKAMIRDFLQEMEELEAPPKKQTWQEQKRTAKAILVAFGGVDETRG